LLRKNDTLSVSPAASGGFLLGLVSGRGCDRFSGDALNPAI
jgi:hypothetical protein